MIPEESQIIWPLVWVPIAGLVSWLASNGFFYREISRKLHLRIDEGNIPPWWMGMCFPIYYASKTAYAIMPFNILLMWTWKALYWIRSKPVEFIWKEFGIMYTEVQDIKHDNKMLRMENSQMKNRYLGIEIWKAKDAPFGVLDGIEPKPKDEDWVGFIPKDYDRPLWMSQGYWLYAEVHTYPDAKVIIGSEAKP